jgi:hypothetical protein
MIEEGTEGEVLKAKRIRLVSITTMETLTSPRFVEDVE